MRFEKKQKLQNLMEIQRKNFKKKFTKKLTQRKFAPKSFIEK